MTELEIFGLGCLGGAFPDVLRLIKGRHDGAPGYMRDWFFWAMLVVLMLIGGFAAFFGHPAGWKEAIAFGFTAPEVISRVFGASDADRGAPVAGVTFIQKIRRWWGI